MTGVLSLHENIEFPYFLLGFAVAVLEYLLQKGLIVVDEFPEFLFVFRCLYVADSYLVTKLPEKEIDIPLHAREIPLKHPLYLADGIDGISDIFHIHLSVRALISLRKDNNGSVIDKRSKNPRMFGIDRFYFFCIHCLTVSKNPQLVKEEYLPRYDYLEIHFLIDHNIQVSVE